MRDQHLTISTAFDQEESPWLLIDRRGRRPELGPASYVFLPWISNAACRGRGSVFFGPANERPEARKVREAEARRICSSCTVLEPCRRWAREEREYGYWGGESEEERVAAGYPVAMPVGRVAKRMQILRAAARSLSQASRGVMGSAE
jgi:WhiB family transcriptional regulator, redox-sensing transcriptional regulator